MSLLIYPFFCQAYYPIFKSQAMMFQAPDQPSMKDPRLALVKSWNGMGSIYYLVKMAALPNLPDSSKKKIQNRDPNSKIAI